MGRGIALAGSHNGGKPRREAAFQATRHGWTWQYAVAVFGLAGGIIAITFGSVLTAATWIVGTVGSGWYMQRVGTVLLLSTIPLLILGAHCLDLAEKKSQQKK
jgi:hypothetical protein